MGALLALFPAAGHDQLWFLMMARRWLAGATLYGPEIFDSNPPAIVWASALPVWLGTMLHVAATLPAKALVLAAEAATAFFCAVLLRRARPGSERVYLTGLLFAYVVLTLVVPARDFGQRDQLLSFLILPYVLCSAMDMTLHRMPGWRLVAAVLAAVGICLKPQYALIPVAIEISLLLQPGQPGNSRARRLLRPEPVLILAAGLMYLAAIRLWAPLYFSQALPVLRETYWAVGHLGVGSLLLEAIQLDILAAIASAMYFLAASRSVVAKMLLIAGAAAFVAYMIQGTGWYYQQIPAITLFGAAVAVQGMELAVCREIPVAAWMVPAVSGLSLLALVLTTHFMGYPFTRDRAFAITVPDPAIFQTLATGTPVAMLTTSVDAAMMPVERYQLTWAQRTNNLWTLPAILRSETPGAGAPPRRVLGTDELHALEAMQYRWMVEDFERWRPQLVLVERCHKTSVPCQLLEDRDDDLLACFLRDAAFANVWKSYHRVGRSGPFDQYVREESR